MSSFTNLIKKHIELTPEMTAFISACEIWANISRFMTTSSIDDVDEYTLKLDNFKSNLKEFYNQGAKCFLSIDT